MAIIYEATLTPTKRELMQSWIDRRAGRPGGALETVGSYRFDDPAGEVGVEAFLLRRGDELLHLVLTYRPAPLASGDAELVGTTEHSTLGTRWVYDGTTDPVAVSCFGRALRGEQEQAVLEVWRGDELVDRQQSTVRLRLEGATPPTGLEEKESQVHVHREVPADPQGDVRLVADWGGGRAVVATLWTSGPAQGER